MTLTQGVQGAATNERLSALRLGGIDPIVVVHGPGVDDLFVSRDYQLRNIQESLWALLRAEGFERIVFSSLAEAVYFRDPRSHALSRRASSPASPAPAGGNVMRNPLQGPLGRLKLPGVGSTARPGDAAEAQPRALSDQHIVMMLDGFMRQSNLRTAVVFVQAEESLRFIQADRTLAARVADWLASPLGNLVVLIFRRDSLDEVRDFVDGLNRFPRLEAFLAGSARTGRGSVRVHYPLEPELERLVHLLRLRQDLQIGDWRELPAVLRAMVASPATSVREWQARLLRLRREATPFGLQVLRANGWVEAAFADGRGVWERLNDLRGLDTVKAHLEQLRWQLTAEANLRADGVHPTEPAAHHLVFTGNPGTGKTTVARLVGELYRDLGVLRRGHVVSVEASELIAEHVGGTAAATNRKIDEALDGVLFIDEAYRLSEDVGGFGQQAINALLTRMENDRDRLVVIVAGYPEPMDAFLASNPGLRSRFPQANVITFSDFEPEQLFDILRGQLAGLVLSTEAEHELRSVTRSLYEGRDSDFGNARAMRDLTSEIKTRWAQRVRGSVKQPVQPQDVPERLRSAGARQLPTLQELQAELNELVGLAPVKEFVSDLAARLRLRQRRGLSSVHAPHMLFLGPPGTGKTTVARLMGRIFRSLGLLRSGQVIEVQPRSDLVAEWIGQTAPKTRAVMRRARDGVLFIDEAYSLSRDESSGRDFGGEVLDTLVQEMESMRGRLVVIAAGYPEPMERFLAANAGLRSRFGERVTFPDYSEDELLQILRRSAEQDGYSMPPAVVDRARMWLSARRARDVDQFGNARVVQGLFEQMEKRMARRSLLASDADAAQLNTFDIEDVPDALG